MACSYLNSAGTDLDSLFLVDNSNGGALGFLTSTGQDLGNRFSKASTLGYNVGYKNSAGTDIGFLRGKMSAPTGTMSATFSNMSVYEECEREDTEGTCEWECYGLNGIVSWSVSGNYINSVNYELTYYRSGECSGGSTSGKITSGSTTNKSGTINFSTPCFSEHKPDRDGKENISVTLKITLVNSVGSTSAGSKTSSSYTLWSCSYAGGG